jgi:23S rRNA (adenine-N6)-dimethyltransferase
MKRLSNFDQNFLRSPLLVTELVNYAHIRKNDLVYDLGAGSGVITSVLSGRARQVVAVEVEPHALTALHDNMADYDNVTIVTSNIIDTPEPNEPYKIVANIPFSLSAAIVRKYTESTHPPKSMHIIVQKQFARKLVPGSDHFTSQLSAQLGPRFSAQIRHELERSDYTPPPAVDTVFLELKLRDEPLLPEKDLPNYRAFVEQCFDRQKFFATTPRLEAKIAVHLRPSQLSLAQWAALFEYYMTSNKEAKVQQLKRPQRQHHAIKNRQRP